MKHHWNCLYFALAIGQLLAVGLYFLGKVGKHKFFVTFEKVNI
jgi:hypothetical protein